jgi:SAM-dependent methyltransferase
MTYADEYARILAQNYDSVYGVLRDPSGDIEFYVEQARRSGGPILELGCGTGRILVPTAAKGLNCVGLDASEEMLAVLRAKNPPANVKLVKDSMEAFELDAEFQLVTAPFRAFQHLLDVESQLRTLANVKRHLAPGGTFVFDVFDPNLARMAVLEEPENESVVFCHEGYEMRRLDSIHRDPATQIMTVTFRFVGGPVELQGKTDVKMRWFYRYEIEHLLARAGFSDVTIHGGFRNEPWQSGRDTVVIARV